MTNLARFMDAQHSTYAAALAELTAGRKRTHWMWYVFPQLKGLGISSTAQFYGLAGLAEAQAYLVHPVLGPRLEACTRAVLPHAGRPLADIFGSPDDMKFRSSMTLFDRAAPGGLYAEAIGQLCGGEADPRTLAMLGA